MEAVVKKIRGDELKATKCFFCSSTKDLSILAIFAGEEHDGLILRFFGICPSHLRKQEALLSGNFDIDNIKLDEDLPSTPRLRLRG